jgi:hypothetical protein
MPQSDYYRPTVDEIGSRLGSRTRTSQGRRLGTFSSETNPTASIVDELIADAMAVVESAVGRELEEEYWPMAKTAVIAYTCMSIELGYYPETASQTDSAYTAFRDRYAQQVTFIEKSLNQKRPNERGIVSLRQRSALSDTGGRLDPQSNELLP